MPHTTATPAATKDSVSSSVTSAPYADTPTTAPVNISAHTDATMPSTLALVSAPPTIATFVTCENNNKKKNKKKKEKKKKKEGREEEEEGREEEKE